MGPRSSINTYMQVPVNDLLSRVAHYQYICCQNLRLPVSCGQSSPAIETGRGVIALSFSVADHEELVNKEYIHAYGYNIIIHAPFCSINWLQVLILSSWFSKSPLAFYLFAVITCLLWFVDMYM